ncbi:hypothetical protein I4U23_000086 [Adineta vaga]|nr:hypothetical protein I4U23_000086 [Adineta vaga]
MPRQGRIDDKAFKNALNSLSIDQIMSLDICKSTSEIWGELCIKMGKKNSAENRRACFDLWKRKGYKSEEIINNMQQENEHVDNNNFVELVPTNIDKESPPTSEVKETEQFIEQLQIFLNKQGKNISMKYDHDLDNVCCFGNIISIQLACKCQDDCNESTDTENKSAAMSISYDYYDSVKSNNHSIESDGIVKSNNLSIEYEDTTIPSVCTPLRLILSPTSLVLTSTPKTSDKFNHTVPSILDGKDTLSPMKTPDHTNIDAEQMELLTFLQRNTEKSSFFTFDINIIEEAERSKSIIISQSDMEILKKLREEEQTKIANEQEEDENSQATDSEDSDNNSNSARQRRNLEWTVIMDEYVQQSNDYCVFMYRRHYFGVVEKKKKKKKREHEKFFMSISAHCKFSTCTCTFKAIIDLNGKLKVNYKGEIRHLKAEIYSRPQRGSRRQKLRRHDIAAESLQKIKEEQARTIYPGESIPGYLQAISTDPLRLICFTAGGLAVYHRCALNMPLSWDATGGIVINREKRIYYYELTMQNLIKKGPSFPITIMLSNSHGTADIVHWMNCFKEKYKETYGFGHAFPKPPIIHSDRALVPFGMWLMALLVNSSTLDEMIIVWENICIVLISTNQNDRFKMSLSLMSQMADKMNKDPDQTNDVLKNVTVTSKAQLHSDLDTNAYENNANELPLGEEETVLQIESSFKGLFTRIYEESKEAMKIYDEPQWNNLPSNPLFSATFLARLLKLYMPTAPIWSNLLLGNFKHRYGYKSNFEAAPCSCHTGRTTGVSESRMRVLKEAILSRKVYARIDEVVTKLGENIGAVECQFADYIFMKNNKNHVLPASKQKKAGENWAKRLKTAADNAIGYTSGSPQLNLTGMMNTRLLGQNDDENLGNVSIISEKLLDTIGQLPEFLKFENQANNCWFNSVMQMILSSGQIVKAIISMGLLNADLESSIIKVVGDILYVLTKKHKNYTKKGKTIVEANFISERLGYLVWAGVKIRLRKYNCAFDFFLAAVVPSLAFYGIDFKSNITVSMQCCSCNKVSIISTQIWDYILVTTSTVYDNLIDVLADTFSPTLRDIQCPQCTSNDHQPVSLSIAKFPKHLFLRFHTTTTTTKNTAHKLSTHVDLSNVLSNHIVSTRSYSRFTLQSFIVFTGQDNEGHYYTIANRKNEWYKLDDDKITILPPRTIFGHQTDRPSAILAL